MISKNKIGIMLYGKRGEVRDVFSESKYKLLAEKMIQSGLTVETITYNDSISEQLFHELVEYKSILVWINPVEKDMDRRNLDNLLTKVSNEGVYVTAHPNTILRIGTKDVLYQTREMTWSNDVNIFRSYKEFETGFIKSLEKYGTRILKPYRGNGGKGIIKISIELNDKNEILLQYAEKEKQEERINLREFLNRYKDYFDLNNKLIDQEWCQQITNGMVRCYLSLDKVVGFGYQEINILYPINKKDDFTKSHPSQRNYYTEACGLFRDLKIKMENEWVPQLIDQFSMSIEDLPIIWDADFFIDNASNKNNKYILCEINVSSVSPFPESAIMPIIEILKRKI